MTMMNSNNNGLFGDTSLTKVFVGGLPWETRKEALKQHFEKYGEILEAVIISDKISGRSKGYGFVTFKEADAAKKACEDQASLIINGRRANCNLASIGARRQNSSPSPPQPKQGAALSAANNQQSNQVQWYYPVGTHSSSSPMPFHHQAYPYYGYTPTYIATDINYNYNQKLSYGGPYMNGGHHVSHVYPRHAMVGANTPMQMYPLYYYHHHPTETMGVPAQYIHPTVVAPVRHFAAVPAGMVSKPVSITPHTGTVGGVECFKAVV